MIHIELTCSTRLFVYIDHNSTELKNISSTSRHMPTLSKELRNTLAKVTLAARQSAEDACRAALENLAVHEKDYRPHMSVEQRLLRSQLRARGRALGDTRDERSGAQEIRRLAEAAAYEHWHRFLFTRFLADNHLLHTDAEHGHVPVTLQECDELAPELNARDGFDLACRFAAKTLPGVFRSDDPVLQLRLALNDEVELKKLLDSLPHEVFTGTDALGWTYQFWQEKRKEEVNKSGKKIGADELPAVTQLFTEDYMVEFLLDNTLGAWWAGRRGKVISNQFSVISCHTEADARRVASLPPKDGLPGIDWTYLRFVQASEKDPIEKEPGRPAPDNHSIHQTQPGRDAPAPFFDPHQEIDITWNNLPHWQQNEAWIFVTWRLADSLPAAKLRDWQEEKTIWLNLHPLPWDDATTREFHERFTVRMEAWLDAGEGSCLLRQPEIRRIVTDAFAHFDGERYDLGDYVVMPNHVHLLFCPRHGHDLPAILHSWKSFTSKQINHFLGRSGPIWQADYWDRIIRNPRHLEACQRYIAENPTKAKLRDEEFSMKSKEPGRPAPDWIRELLIPGRDAPAPLALFAPASGTFPGWPKTAKEIKFLDPCMGSGHFVVFALPLLARMRMEEEGLSAAQAIYATLRDNVFGLELDERCAQIAAFNLALTAWKLGGYQPLPPLHLACSGLAPHATEKDWLALAGDGAKSDRLQRGMARLYALFKDAPVLGSLINPRALSGDLVEADFHELRPLLETALAQESKGDATHDLSAVGLAEVEALAKVEMAVTARGLAKAAEILAGQFTLVATNVPYLGRGKQDDVLKGYCERVHPEAKADLATCFVERCLEFCQRSGAVPAPSEHRGGTPRLLCGTTALVTPQNWLFMGSYKKFRSVLLVTHQWDWILRLGEHAFDSPAAAGAFVAMCALTHKAAAKGHRFLAVEVADEATPEAKAAASLTKPFVALEQSLQLKNPDARVSLVTHEKAQRLSEFCASFLGLGTGDYPHHGRCYWEFAKAPSDWTFQQGSVESPCLWGGREYLVAWDFEIDRVRGLSEAEREQIHNQDQSGQQAWGKWGVAVGLMRDLKPTLYTGERHEKAVAALIPTSPKLLPAIWALCSSRDFHDLVRQLDQNIIVANGTLTKIPFDLAHWQKVAAEKYPHGLPKPFSNDPTQWLFNGHPHERSGGVPPPASQTPGRDAPAPFALHVAVARLLGYRWPRQTGSSFPDCPALGPDGLETLADEDGIVCLPPINREQPAAHRLRALMQRSGGVPPPNQKPNDNFPGRDAPAPLDERAVVASAGPKGSKSTTLEDWLRDEFFEQHCEIFHQRPFIWHIWDGRKDGFHALVNYHNLDNASLQKLTYSYLGDWIRHQEEDAKAGKPGADARLGAARALQTGLAKILEGEAPYDIFVRWKPLAKQPMGWHPDLNDGVRLNIRPFMSATDVGKKGAGILRSKPGIKWDKDRGKEPQRDKSEYPWFWCEEEPGTDPETGKEFTGHRWNGVHLTLEQKAKARK